MGKALSGELSCPCDRSCCLACDKQKEYTGTVFCCGRGLSVLWFTFVLLQCADRLDTSFCGILVLRLRKGLDLTINKS